MTTTPPPGGAGLLGEARVAVVPDLSQLVSGFNMAERETREFQQHLNQAARQMEQAVGRFSDIVDNRLTAAFNRSSRGAQTFNQRIIRVASAFGLIPGPAGAAAARLASLLTTVTGLSPALTAVGVAVGAVTYAFAGAASEAEAFERSALRTEALLRATGHAAGVTTQDINRLGEEIEETTLATSEEVKEAAQALIQFGSVSGKEFERTLRVAEDLRGSFGSMQGAVEAMGRAFERPAEAARMFRRIGLHEAVLLEAAAMQEAGREAESYTFILDALQKKVGGAGEAEAMGLTGSLHRLGDAAGDFFRRLGEGTGITQALATIFNNAAKGANRLADVLFAVDKATQATDAASAAAARTAAQKALEERKRADARAAQLRADEQARKDAAEEIKRLAKAEADRADQLETQREEALETALRELAITQELAPALLASGKTREKINEELRFEVELKRQLAQLGVAEGSAAQLEEVLRAQRAVNDEIEDGIEKRDKLNDALRDARLAIQDAGTDTALIGGSFQRQEMVEFRDRLMETIESLKIAGVETGLLERQVDSLVAAFGKAVQVRETTQLLSDMIDDTDALMRETQALAATFGMTTGQAAAYRFEQEALARAAKLVEEITPEEAANIHAIAQAYGVAAQQASTLAGRQEALSAVSGELSNFLSDLRRDAHSAGEAFLRLAENITDAIIQASLFGQGPFAGALGTANTGGLIGGGIGALLGLGGAGAAAGGAFSAVGGVDAAMAIGALHKGRKEGDPRPIPSRRVPISTFVRAPRLHKGLRQGEFPAILEDGEEVTPKHEVRKMRTAKGDTFNFYMGRKEDVDSLNSSMTQLMGKASDAQFVSRQRNR